MLRRSVLTVVALGMFGVVAGPFASAYGAQWYPFYGYHRPSYLGQPCAAAVQPSAPEVSTAYYPPAQDTVVPAQETQYDATGAGWYPFYGHRRPGYLDR